MFFAIHDIDSDDVPSTHEDVISHFLNGKCAGRKAPGCSEVAHEVRSPVKMALSVTEAIVTQCKRNRVSLDELRTYCSAIGVTTTQRPEYAVLTQKLTTRCDTLRPLLDCDELDTILSGVETLGKKSLHHLSIQHDLDADPKRNADSTKTMLVDHITSGRCEASTSSLCSAVNDEYKERAPGSNSDLETYILQAAGTKAKLSKKTLRRVLKSKNIEFDDDENIGELRRHLRSYITTLRKAKKPEWDRNHRAELESEHLRHLDKIREEWPQPASMELKEDCIRNFRNATSSDSLRKFTCACCAESISVSDQKVQRLEEINLELLRDRTSRIFDESCIPPEVPFADGPLADLMIDPDGVIPESVESSISLQLCARCDSSLRKGKLPRLAVANLNILLSRQIYSNILPYCLTLTEGRA